MRTPLIIVDDSTVVRQRLRALLARIPGVEIIGEAGTAQEALDTCLALRPKVVTLDISLPGRSGLEIVSDLRSLEPPPHVVILTNFPYPSLRSEAMRLGAAAFLLKTDPPEVITQTIAELAGRPAGTVEAR